jgi:hypothetical protein
LKQLPNITPELVLKKWQELRECYDHRESGLPLIYKWLKEKNPLVYGDVPHNEVITKSLLNILKYSPQSFVIKTYLEIEKELNRKE